MVKCDDHARFNHSGHIIICGHNQVKSGIALFHFGEQLIIVCKQRHLDRNAAFRAKIIKSACDQALEALGVESPILDIARNLESSALQDDYFIQRKLYPNVDFYSGIILQAMGFPTNMFTVLFAIGRTPGWLAHWKEIATSGKRIHRPRQIYQGKTLRSYSEASER